MTEQEWRSCTDPEPMVGALSADRYQRELRLFAVACARRGWHLLPAPARAAVDASEEFAEGRCAPDLLSAAVDRAADVAQAHWSGGRSPDARAYAESAAVDASSVWPRTAANVLATTTCAASAAGCAAAEVDEARYDEVFESARRAELAAQAELLRGLVPSPAA